MRRPPVTTWCSRSAATAPPTKWPGGSSARRPRSAWCRWDPGNGLARTLGIPLRPERAVETLAHAVRRRMDVGMVNGRPFLNVAGAGFDAQVGADFHAHGLRGGRRGVFTYVRLSLRRTWSYRAEQWSLHADDGRFRGPRAGGGVRERAAVRRRRGHGARRAPGRRAARRRGDRGRAAVRDGWNSTRLFLGDIEKLPPLQHITRRARRCWKGRARSSTTATASRKDEARSAGGVGPAAGARDTGPRRDGRGPGGSVRVAGRVGMKLPHADDVRIDERKVRGYLLSETHPVGRFKARVFAALGFDDSAAQAFIGELRRLAAGGDISEMVETPFGQKYAVPGDLQGPLGTAPVLTVWFLERGQERVRLVTVRPR